MLLSAAELIRQISFCQIKLPYLAGVICLDRKLPVGVCGAGLGRRGPGWQQPLAEVDRLLIFRGGRGRRGAEVKWRAQPIFSGLPVRGSTIWAVPTHSRYLRGGQSREPVGAAALRGVVVWREERGGWKEEAREGWRARLRCKEMHTAGTRRADVCQSLA